MPSWRKLGVECLDLEELWRAGWPGLWMYNSQKKDLTKVWNKIGRAVCSEQLCWKDKYEFNSNNIKWYNVERNQKNLRSIWDDGERVRTVHRLCHCYHQVGHQALLLFQGRVLNQFSVPQIFFLLFFMFKKSLQLDTHTWPLFTCKCPLILLRARPFEKLRFVTLKNWNS